MSNKFYSYSSRRVLTESGVGLIWPFMNIEPNREEVEIFVDSNTLTRLDWLFQMPEDLGKNLKVNLWMAMEEQWHSNPCFRENPEAHVKKWIDCFDRYKIAFREDYWSEQLWLLKNNNEALKSQFSLATPFVAIMKKLLSQKLSADESLKKLSEVFCSDIPRFSGLFMLMALSVVLKENQSVKLENDKKPAYSYISSFMDFQPGKKGESYFMSVSYLINRVGDLNMWYLLPLLRQKRMKINSGSVLATGDKALHNFIFRLISPVFCEEGLDMGFALNGGELSGEVLDQINPFMRLMKEFPPRESHALDQQLERMKAAFNIAKDYTDNQREKNALDEIFNEWWLPGHGVEVKLPPNCAEF